jgi:hypothetical protein
MSMVAGPALPKLEAQLESDEDGKFEFPSVQPGDWRVEAIQNDLPASSGGASAIVGAHDIASILCRLWARLARSSRARSPHVWKKAGQHRSNCT